MSIISIVLIFTVPAAILMILYEFIDFIYDYI